MNLCEFHKWQALESCKAFQSSSNCLSVCVGFRCSVWLWSHGLQHARLPCASPSAGVCSNSRPLSRWCHPTISSSVTPVSSYPQSFPESGSLHRVARVLELQLQHQSLQWIFRVFFPLGAVLKSQHIINTWAKASGAIIIQMWSQRRPALAHQRFGRLFLSLTYQSSVCWKGGAWAAAVAQVAGLGQSECPGWTLNSPRHQSS